MYASRLLLCSLCFMVAGCSFTIIRKHGDETYFTGPIKPGDYARFEKSVGPDSRLVIVRSQGGNTLEAIKIAELIQKRGLSVKVDKYCASACASFLFVAGKHREIPNDAFVAFHVTNEEALIRAMLPDALKRAIKDGSPEEEQEVRAGIKDIETMDRKIAEIYRVAGADVALFEKMRMLSGISVDSTTTEFDGQSRRFDVHSNASGCIAWIPDEQELAEIGVSLAQSYRRPERKEIASLMHNAERELFFGSVTEIGQPLKINCVKVTTSP